MKKFLVLLSLPLVLASCSQAETHFELTKDLKPRQVQVNAADEQFKAALGDFSIDVFKNTYEQKNTIISPLSLMTSLSMVANGAKGTTLAQMEEVLGNNISISDINKYLAGYLKSLSNTEKTKFLAANSVWIKKDFTVKEDFLQTLVDYFSAQAFHAEFNQQTVKDINKWISDKTDKVITKLLDDIPESAVMYLINTLLFDSMWNRVYTAENIVEDDFLSFDNAVSKTTFMQGKTESYLQLSNGSGFVKAFSDFRYGFAAFLPDEDVSIAQFIQSLSYKSIKDALIHRSLPRIVTALPKFEFEFEVDMKEVLIDLGMENAFSDFADFSNVSETLPLQISSVKHKAKISVHENGTKAAAVTTTEMVYTSAPAEEEIKYVILDRPFVFAIVDLNNNIPLFLGTYIKAA